MTSEEFKKNAFDLQDRLRSANEELHKRKLQVHIQEDYVSKIQSEIFYLMQEPRLT